MNLTSIVLIIVQAQLMAIASLMESAFVIKDMVDRLALVTVNMGGVQVLTAYAK